MDEKPQGKEDIEHLSSADPSDEGEAGQVDDGPRELIPGFLEMKQGQGDEPFDMAEHAAAYQARNSKYVAYTIKLPNDQLAAMQSIWLELKRLYGTHSPDKSGMIQQAIQDWLKRWDGPDRQKLLNELLEIREDTRRRQYKKG